MSGFKHILYYFDGKGINTDKHGVIINETIAALEKYKIGKKLNKREKYLLQVDTYGNNVSVFDKSYFISINEAIKKNDQEAMNDSLSYDHENEFNPFEWFLLNCYPGIKLYQLCLSSNTLNLLELTLSDSKKTYPVTANDITVKNSRLIDFIKLSI